MSGRRAMRTELGGDARTMARGAAANVGGALLTTVVSFALSLLITHELRAGAFGLYSIALATVLLAQAPAVLGLDVGAVRFVALRASEGDEEGARGSVQAAFAVVALTSTALTLVLYWKAPWLTGSFFRKPEATDPVRLVALSLPALALTRVAIGSLQGLGIMRYSALLNPARVVVNVAVAAPVLGLGYGATGLAGAFLATQWAALALALALLVRALPRAFLPAVRRWRLPALLRFSLPQTLTTLLLQTILWTDTLVLGRLRTAAEVAVYAIVQRLLSPAQTVSTATGQMFAPRVAAEDARGDRRALELMLKRVTYWNVSIATPVFAALLLLPGPLLRLFGSTYSTGTTALAILAAGQLFNAATGPLGQVINMSGRPHVTLVNNAAVAVLNVVGCLLLIPPFGLTGAACSTTGAITLVNLIKLAQVRAFFRINPFRLDALRALAAGVAALALVAPLTLLVPWPGVEAQVVLSGLLLVVLYAALFWLLAAGEEERELLRRRSREVAEVAPAPVRGRLIPPPPPGATLKADS
jgi:O-antigen/teichoic acid export membrane protein